jgi:hypothetical protein
MIKCVSSKSNKDEDSQGNKRGVFTLSVVKTLAKPKFICCKMNTMSYRRMQRGFVVNETRGVGSFLGKIKKNELAANNGDTLGEAVISVIRNEFRIRQQRKIQLKTTTENCTTSSSTIFSSEVLKDANQ